MISSLWIAKTGLDAQQTNMDVIANNPQTSAPMVLSVSARYLKICCIRPSASRARSRPSRRRCLQGCKSVPACVRSPRSVCTVRGTCRRPTTVKMWRLKGRAFPCHAAGRYVCLYPRRLFRVDQNGQLVTAGGFQVQPAITIPANALSITIGRDGVVSVTQQGQAAPVQVGQLNLTTFMNDTGLESIGENLYIETQSSGAPNESTPGLNGAGLLYQGYVETSNVNVAEELVNMIQVQRAYEINSKAVSTTDQMLQKLTQL